MVPLQKPGVNRYSAKEHAGTLRDGLNALSRASTLDAGTHSVGTRGMVAVRGTAKPNDWESRASVCAACAVGSRPPLLGSGSACARASGAGLGSCSLSCVSTRTQTKNFAQSDNRSVSVCTLCDRRRPRARGAGAAAHDAPRARGACLSTQRDVFPDVSLTLSAVHPYGTLMRRGQARARPHASPPSAHVQRVVQRVTAVCPFARSIRPRAVDSETRLQLGAQGANTQSSCTKSMSPV